MLFDTQFNKDSAQFQESDKNFVEVVRNLASLTPEGVKKLSSDERKTLQLALGHLQDPSRANALDVGAVKNVADGLRFRKPAGSFFAKISSAWNSRFSGSLSDAKLLQEIKTAEQKIWFNQAEKYLRKNEMRDGIYMLLRASSLGSLDAIEALATQCKAAGNDRSKMVELIPDQVLADLYLEEGKLAKDLSSESREMYEKIQSRDPQTIVAYLDAKSAEIKMAEKARQIQEASPSIMTKISKWIGSLRS